MGLRMPRVWAAALAAVFLVGATCAGEISLMPAGENFESGTSGQMPPYFTALSDTEASVEVDSLDSSNKVLEVPNSDGSSTSYDHIMSATVDIDTIETVAYVCRRSVAGSTGCALTICANTDPTDHCNLEFDDDAYHGIAGVQLQSNGAMTLKCGDDFQFAGSVATDTDFQDIMLTIADAGTSDATVTATIDGGNDVVVECPNLESTNRISLFTYTGDETSYYDDFSFNGASTEGDPHFTGFRGQEYDILGEAGMVYDIISMADMQLNARFAEFEGASGTWYSEMAIVSADGAAVVLQVVQTDRLRPEVVLTGHRELDGVPTKRGDGLLLGGGLRVWQPRPWEVRAVGYGLYLVATFRGLHSGEPASDTEDTYEPLHIDLQVSTLEATRAAAVDMHGLLGQTWRDTFRADAEDAAFQFLEGSLDDYLVESGDIIDTTDRVSRMHRV